MERRSFLGRLHDWCLGGFVGGFFGSWAQDRPSGAHGWSPTKAEDMPQEPLPATANFDPRTDKILIAVGASIPSISRRYTAGGEPDDSLVFRFASPESYGTQGPAWIEQVPDVSKIPQDQYPRCRGFAVTPQIVVGTIDEIVANFRENLIGAVSRYFEVEYDRIVGNSQQNRELQAVYNLLPRRPGKAATIQIHGLGVAHPQELAYAQRIRELEGDQPPA